MSKMIQTPSFENPTSDPDRPRAGRSYALILCSLLVLLGSPVQGQDEPPAGDPGMEAFIAAMTPGEHHQYLAGFAGEWTYQQAMWEVPGEEPMRATGEATKTVIMGGRYLQEEMRGEMMGQPFTGRGVTGYDNMRERFVGTWIDNLGTGIIYSHGEASESGDAHTLHGEYLNPMSREVQKLRMVTRKVDENRHVFEYYVTMGDGPEIKQMEIEYIRKQ